MAATLAQAVNESGDPVRCRLFHCENGRSQDACVGLGRPWLKPTNAVLARLFGVTVTCDFGVTTKLLRHVQDAQVVHIHNLHGYYVNFQRLLGGLQDRPTIWTWHDMWGATGRCAFSHSCEGWRSACSSCPHLEYYPAAWIDHAGREYQAKEDAYRRLEHLYVVTPSEWLRQVAIDRGFHRSRVSVIPNPVALDVYVPQDKHDARRRLGLDCDKSCILFVAADCSDGRKGYDDFAKLVSSLDVIGLAVGREPRRPAQHVRHVGPILDPARLATYYAAADALAITSKADNYPNTAIEAMACGTPVMSYAIGGVASQMPPFWDGTVVAGDIQGMARKTGIFLAAGGKDRAIVSTLRAYAAKTWAPHEVAQQYISAYHSILQ